jgi:hypothetical protein
MEAPIDALLPPANTLPPSAPTSVPSTTSPGPLSSPPASSGPLPATADATTSELQAVLKLRGDEILAHEITKSQLAAVEKDLTYAKMHIQSFKSDTSTPIHEAQIKLLTKDVKTLQGVVKESK